MDILLNLFMKNLAQMYPKVPPTRHPNITPEYIPISPQPKVKQNTYAKTVSNMRDLSNVMISE